MNESGSMPGARPAPWWRHGYVWLVIAGPAAVVVAGLATAWIAVRHPDPVIQPDYWRQGVDTGKTPGEGARALVPAMQGRNHAAGGGNPATP